jgi:hypothetical protein
MHSSQLDQAKRLGPVFRVWQTIADDGGKPGDVKLYAQQGDWTLDPPEPLTWFDREVYWRWKTSPGPFSERCVYIPEDEPDFCTHDFYGLTEGKPKVQPDGKLIGVDRLVSYVSSQDYLPIDVALDTDRIYSDMWFNWKSASMQSTPQGTRIVPVAEALGADSLILVSDIPPTAVPEPSAAAMCVIGLGCFLRRMRRGKW